MVQAWNGLSVLSTHWMNDDPDSIPIRARSVVALIVKRQRLKVEKGHNIIEIALVKHNADGSVEEWSSLVKPTKRISPAIIPFTAFLLHG